METIKNYLEAMFASMPNTESVIKAKAELLQMMEDKYNEMIAEGHTENEAVGDVIANFGNLDELADSLNLQEEVREVKQEKTVRPRRPVSLDEAKDYLHDMARFGIMLGAAIMLCIICVVPNILGDIYDWPEWIGVSSMFIILGGAIILFVYRRSMLRKWDFIRGQFCQTDMMTSQYVSDAKKSYTSSHAIRLTVGIVLCALCWLPAVIFDGTKGIGDLASVFLFIFVGLGVFLIVSTNVINGSFDNILSLNDAKTVSGSYAVSHKTEYISDTVSLIMNVYWPTITCIYLIWSFLSFDWWKTWIIWPVASIIYSVLKHNLKKN